MSFDDYTREVNMDERSALLSSASVSFPWILSPFLVILVFQREPTGERRILSHAEEAASISVITVITVISLHLMQIVQRQQKVMADQDAGLDLL